jgi:hypothetical protein
LAFFRGQAPDASVWRRFRSGLDGFTFAKESDHFAARVVTNAERAADLFCALLAHLPPAVDVAVDDRRGQRRWTAARVALPDVQEALTRLKGSLANAGGVEIAVYTTEDQLTLSPQLELFIYARSDRWLYLLLGLGLEERPASPARSWKAGRREFEPAPELSTALAATAARLGLQPA